VTLPVAVHEAALGAKVEVPTLGDRVKVKIPPGTASGARLRVPTRGLPGDPAGDLVVDVQIVLPPIKDERSRELLREFAQLNDVDVRKHLFE
jgi:molecular chaperone DnaJ